MESIIGHAAHDCKTPREEITLVLVDAGGDNRPMACRAKQLLKLALRGFHLKCTEARGLGLEAGE